MGKYIDELMSMPGRIDLGPEPLDEKTAKRLIKSIKRIESGKMPKTKVPKQWVDFEKKHNPRYKKLK